MAAGHHADGVTIEHSPPRRVDLRSPERDASVTQHARGHRHSVPLALLGGRLAALTIRPTALGRRLAALTVRSATGTVAIAMVMSIEHAASTHHAYHHHERQQQRQYTYMLLHRILL